MLWYLIVCFIKRWGFRRCSFQTQSWHCHLCIEFQWHGIWEDTGLGIPQRSMQHLGRYSTTTPRPFVLPIMVITVAAQDRKRWPSNHRQHLQAASHICKRISRDRIEKFQMVPACREWVLSTHIWNITVGWASHTNSIMQVPQAAVVHLHSRMGTAKCKE